MFQPSKVGYQQVVPDRTLIFCQKPSAFSTSQSAIASKKTPENSIPRRASSFRVRRTSAHAAHVSRGNTQGHVINKLDRVQEFKIEKMRAVMVVKWYLLKAKLRTGSNNHWWGGSCHSASLYLNIDTELFRDVWHCYGDHEFEWLAACPRSPLTSIPSPRLYSNHPPVTLAVLPDWSVASTSPQRPIVATVTGLFHFWLSAGAVVDDTYL